ARLAAKRNGGRGRAATPVWTWSHGQAREGSDARGGRRRTCGGRGGGGAACGRRGGASARALRRRTSGGRLGGRGRAGRRLGRRHGALAGVGAIEAGPLEDDANRAVPLAEGPTALRTQG